MLQQQAQHYAAFQQQAWGAPGQWGPPNPSHWPSPGPGQVSFLRINHLINF